MFTHVHGMIMCRTLVLAALAFLVQACVTSPYNGQRVTDPSALVTVAGFSHQPNVPLTIEVFNPATGAWEVLGTTTSETTPVFTAGTWQNSPPLYFYRTTVQVSDPATPQTFQRWMGDYRDRVATLRVRSGDIHLLAGEQHSPDCVSQHASQTEDFYVTVQNCDFQYQTWQIRYDAGRFSPADIGAIVLPPIVSIEGHAPSPPIPFARFAVDVSLTNASRTETSGVLRVFIDGSDIAGGFGTHVEALPPGGVAQARFQTYTISPGLHAIHARYASVTGWTVDPRTGGPHALWSTIAEDAETVVVPEPPPPEPCAGAVALCDRRFNEVSFTATHNAYNTEADGFVAPNQGSRIGDQLRHGVRGLMLDLHHKHFADGVWLCHPLGNDCTAGSSSRHIEEAFEEIRQFLAANPREVVTLMLESYVTAQEVDAALLTTGLWSFTYAHAGGAWPTLREMIDANERLVIFVDRHLDSDTQTSQFDWYHNQWDFMFETRWNHGHKPDTDNCELSPDDRSRSSNPLFLLNQFLVPAYRLQAEQMNYNPDLEHRAAWCASIWNHIPNFVGVDFYEIGDVFAAVRALNGI